jgi:hypothetical protein
MALWRTVEPVKRIWRFGGVRPVNRIWGFEEQLNLLIDMVITDSTCLPELHIS